MFVYSAVRVLTDALTNALSKIDALAKKVDGFEERLAVPEEKKSDFGDQQSSSVASVFQTSLILSWLKLLHFRFSSCSFSSIASCSG